MMIANKILAYIHTHTHQALFKGAKKNDQASVMELQNMVAKDFYPGKWCNHTNFHSKIHIHT